MTIQWKTNSSSCNRCVWVFTSHTSPVLHENRLLEVLCVDSALVENVDNFQLLTTTIHCWRDRDLQLQFFNVEENKFQFILIWPHCCNI